MEPLEIRDAILQLAVAPMVAAAVVYLVFLFVPRGAYLGAVLAIIVGFGTATCFRESIDVSILPMPDVEEHESPANPNLDPGTVAWEAATSLIGPSLGETAVQSRRLWLPWCIVFAGLVGAISRIPWMPTAVLRFAASLIVTILLVPVTMQTNMPWVAPLFALAIAAEWELIENVGRDEPGGALPLAFSILFGAAAVVILHAHTAKYATAAGLVSTSCLGVTLVAWLRRGDVQGLAPVAAVGLPGLMLVVYDQTESLIPIAGFLAIALAPLGLAPAAILLKCDVPKWVRTTAIIAGPVAIAAIGVVLAAMYESLPTIE